MIINAAGDALFTFLPLFLGYTAAKKFGLKPMLGLAIGGAMCYPGIQAGTPAAGLEPLYSLLEGTMFASPVYIDFFGIPVISVDYTGTVIPVILAVWFASKCEKFFNKFIPDLVKFFFVPMLTLLVTLPVSVLFLGPIATFGSTLISEFTLAIRGFSPLLAGGIVGFTWQILVIFGMHWGFIPVYINNVMTLGYDNVMLPFVAEPAIYGILLPLKKPFIISCIAGGIGGAFYGQFNFRKFILGGMGIFELPNMMNPDGTMGNIIVAFAGIAISMAVGFVLTMIFYKDKTQEASGLASGGADDEVKKMALETKAKGEKLVVASPLKGGLVELKDVKDEAFSSGALGKGVAVMPKEGVLYAPADGTISAFFPTGHAIGLTTDTGLELLMHVGMDTVQLDGKGFKPLAATGDTVKKGQKLLEFDMELIQEAGYSLVTPVLVTNSDDFAEVVSVRAEKVEPGDLLLSVM